MGEDGEATPLLRGSRPQGGYRNRNQAAGDAFPQKQVITKARSHVVLLVVSAVAVLVVTVTFMSGATSAGQAKTKLAATPNIAGGQEEGGGTGLRQTSGDSKDGWRLQANRASGTAGIAKRDGDDEAEEVGSTGGTSSTSTSKPNVFLFLIDDMGYGDIGYQSTDLSELTPNLDALAAGGIKLTNYYTMSLCTPARASIMTGRYPVRFGMQYSVIMPGAPWGLALTEKILPEYMNEAGYESHMVGKWHLGSFREDAIPSQRGFKTFLGYLNGLETYYTHKNTEASINGTYFFDFGYGNATGYYDVNRPENGPDTCTDGGSRWEEGLEASGDASSCYTGTYSTDVFLGRARQIVKAKTPFDEEPLFLYVAHQSVHAPTGPAPSDEFSPEEKELLEAVQTSTGSDMRVKFAGVVKYLDKRLGEFIDMLEEEGWLDNSLIVVASDNGACPTDGGTNYPLRGTKQSMFEGGSKVPAMVWSKSHLPSEAWGTNYDKMMHSTDWLPTLASVTGAKITGSAGALDGVDHWESLKGNRGAVDDKKEGDSAVGPRTEMLYNWDSYLMSSMNGLVENQNLTQGAFRSGDWKLLVNAWCSGYYSHDPDVIQSDDLLNPEFTCGRTGECEDCTDLCQWDPSTYGYGDMLFNLREDPREQYDVYDQHPEIAKQLRRRAEEVVYAEYSLSVLKEVNEDSYIFWRSNDWWMVPWEESWQSNREEAARMTTATTTMRGKSLLR